jgi:transposase
MPRIKLRESYNIEELKQLCLNAPNKRSFQRLQAISLRAEGKTVPEIARILGCTPKTIRDWIKRFNDGGPAALEYKHTGGRKSKLDPHQEEALIRYLKEGRPDGRRWTLKALAEKIFVEYGVRLSQQQVFERVKRHGLREMLSKSPRNQKKKVLRINPIQRGRH